MPSSNPSALTVSFVRSMALGMHCAEGGLSIPVIQHVAVQCPRTTDAALTIWLGSSGAASSGVAALQIAPAQKKTANATRKIFGPERRASRSDGTDRSVGSETTAA